MSQDRGERMQTHFFAEWLLKRVLEPERAEEVLGDLIEGAKARGTFWFWRSVVAVLLFSMWKSWFRIVAACVLGRAGIQFCLTLFSWQKPLLNKAATAQITHGSIFAMSVMVGLLTVPWFLFPYSLLSGGYRNRLALVSGFACSISVVFWPLLMSPAFVEKYLLEAVLVLAFAAVWRSWRNAVITFSLSALTFSSLFIVLNELMVHQVFAYASWRIGPVIAARITDVCLPLLILWLPGKMYPVRVGSEPLA